MSQEKIDRYKEEKANRKKDAVKQKRIELAGKIVTVVLIIGLLGWIGWSGYRSYQQGKEEQSLQKAWMEQYSSMLEASKAATSGVNLEQSPSNLTKESDDASDESSKSEDETTSAPEDQKESE